MNFSERGQIVWLVTFVFLAIQVGKCSQLTKSSSSLGGHHGHDKNNITSKFTPVPVDPEAEERLRERWTAFIAETNRKLAFDLNVSSPLEVAAVEGRDLFLVCAFTKPLRRHKISFMRLRDFSLLYIGRHKHTPEKKFTLVSSTDLRVWTLRLKSVVPKDSGLYECQVNTSPRPLTRLLNVTVLPGRARIEAPYSSYGGRGRSRQMEATRPSPDSEAIYLNVGGKLTLRCLIETGPVKPQFILWYREDKLVEYSADAIVNTVTNGSSHTSLLEVRNVSVKDSGEYRCGSDLTSEAKIQASIRVFFQEKVSNFRFTFLGKNLLVEERFKMTQYIFFINGAPSWQCRLELLGCTLLKKVYSP